MNPETFTNNFDIEAELFKSNQTNKITISFQKRNKTKGYTLIEGFANTLSKEDIKKFIKKARKKWLFCSVTLVGENSDVIQAQGNHIIKLKTILKTKYNIEDDDIIIKG